MESSSLENVGIELTQRSQNRGDENEYYISSVFEDSSELETAQEIQGGQSCLTSGISANINSRQPQDVTVGRSLPRQTNIRDRVKIPAADTAGASALTSNDWRTGQSDDSSVYLSASLDDIDAVPNSVTGSPKQHESPKEVEGAVLERDDTAKEQNSTAKCSVTINFRLTEDHFCCSSRESSIHLELDIGNLERTRKRNTFAPQVSCQEETRKAGRDAGLRVTSTLEISGDAQGEILDLHPPSHSARGADMDDSDDFQGGSTLEGPETPEYSPTDSESSETSDEADSMERDKKRSLSHADLGTRYSTPTVEESDLVASVGVANEKTVKSCEDLSEDEADIRQSDSNERPSFQGNTKNLDAEGEEKSNQGSKDDLDGDSVLSDVSLDSENNSKTSVVCKDALSKTDPDKNSAPEDCGNHRTATEEDLDEEGTEGKLSPRDLQKGDFHSREKNCKEEEDGRNGIPLQISLDGESANSDVRSDFVEDERLLSTEMLSDSEEHDLIFHGKDDEYTEKGENVIADPLNNLPQTQLVEKPMDSETQGQGDTSHSHTDATSSGGVVRQPHKPITQEIPEGTKNERSVSNVEETKMKLPSTLEHVSEVPRGIFESILYKLYHRMNQRSPRTWRDISRGPCVKELVKEFSKEAMDCPKFPKSHSAQIQRTKEGSPKSQLSESLSDMDDSPKSQSAQVKKPLQEMGKSQLFESFSDSDERGFESRMETSTDDDRLSSDDVPIRSSTPSQEVVVMEIRDELQKPDCSSRRVIQLIKKFGGKGSFKKHKKSEDVKTEDIGETQLPAKCLDEGNSSKDTTTDDKDNSETLSEKGTACARKGSSAWLTNVSVKNLVAIFSEISTSPVLSRRSVSRSSKKCGAWQSKDSLSKGSRTMETQTPGSEAIGSCSNVLLLVQPEYAGNNMLSSRFERKRSTLSVCLPATDLEDCDPDGGRLAADPLRSCASATGLLLVSTAEPVRVRALCSPDDNRAALSQLAHLLHMPDRKAQVRGRSVARDNSLVRQMVAQWDRTSST